MKRRDIRAIITVLTMMLTVPAGAQPAVPGSEAAQIDQIVQDAMETGNVRAAIVKVTRGDEVIIRKAYGPSMTGVPATPEMHFRNGAVAFAYVSTLLLRYVDQKKVGLDDTIDKWMPNLPSADKVTLRMLTNQTSGYPDYETDPKFIAAFNADPFHIFTYQERLDFAFSRPAQFEPGRNWSYAHTNFMILGEILARIGGKPLETLLHDEVIVPMGLKNTTGARTAEIPPPALHTFSAERVPPNYEESTYWNTQWGTPMGADETTTIDDLITTAVAVGTGKLLSRSSYREMTGPKLIGFGERLPGCQPSCFKQSIYYNYGLGTVRSGDWILQNPLLSGLGVVEAYLPSEKVAIAIAVTLTPGAYDSAGNYSSPANPMFQKISAVMAPGKAAPVPPAR
ncbi:MAG TPA: serine hydrolase domain-containing protein [Sphingomicrobium sp.]|nr:serine hydrolase domain-containing protein [Sphingomicrobium sp.]